MNSQGSKLWRIIWIVGIYATLILIFILVVRYKVNFEQRDYSKYLYFYNCSNKLCTTIEKQEDYYGTVKCNGDSCPYIIEQNKDNVILKDSSNSYLYNYKEDQIINNEYNNYSFINDTVLKATNESEKYGLIDIGNNIITDFIYDDIKSYNNGYIVYKENNLYGIKKLTNDSISISPQYKDILYISDTYFGAKNDRDLYQIYTYDNKIATDTYNYLYSINNYTFTFKDNILDIINKDLDSTLIIKINTKYSYLTPSEIKSLNYRVEEGNLLFDIVNNDDIKITYSFNIEKGKLNNN